MMNRIKRKSATCPAPASEPFLGQIIIFFFQLLRLIFGGRGGGDILVS
jgi:hypothetical protein